MCAMQCTTLIETCSQCTNSSIFNLNLPSKLAGMQVLQNGRRFGSTRDPQNFQKFCFVFYNISKPICNVSHLFLSLFSVNRLVNGEKVRFQPIVPTYIFYIQTLPYTHNYDTLKNHLHWPQLFDEPMQTAIFCAVKGRHQTRNASSSTT